MVRYRGCMSRPLDDAAVTEVAVGLLLAQGYETTTVGQLADAVGTSRSSFFRRFRSKEDVVFADHEFLLEHLRAQLRVGGRDGVRAVTAAARTVLEHHLRRPEVALARHRLLQAHPGLRERELVSSHRYERLFAEHLRAVTPDVEDRAWAVTAFAAAVVAVHNEVLRSWLRTPGDVDAPALLDERTEHLVSVLGPALDGRHAPASRVLVASFDAAADPDQVMAAVRTTLGASVG